MPKKEKSIKLLLIEDNEHDTLIISKTLKSSEIIFDIRSCRSAEEAISIIEKNPEEFEVLLVDYLLPGKNGLEFCKIIIEKKLEIPIVILTGKGTLEVAVSAIKAGVSDYIIKDNQLNFLEFLPYTLRNAYAKQQEINARISAEKELLKNQRELKIIVEEKTSDLSATVKKLSEEISKHKKTQKQLRNLIRASQNDRENERIKIARDIHDDLGQILALLKLNLSMVKSNIPPSEKNSHETLNESLNLIEGVIKTVQQIAVELRPTMLDTLGLKDALLWQCDNFKEKTGIKYEMNFNKKTINLNKELSIDIFRIFQEALTNIVRHSKADKVSASFTEDKNSITLNIEDNGIGIKESSINNIHSVGLTGMRERVHSWGGKINIQGKKNKGSILNIIIPVK
ncbi:MAG: response regulator [Spirochaetia bacterium]|nr:response regulator [Spirochaetia bacterium]